MFRILTASVLLLAALAPVRANDDPEPPSGQGAKALEGSWELVKLVGEGGGPPPGSLSVTFTKDEMQIKMGKEVTKTHSFTLDPKKKPAHFDLKKDKGGNTIPGIYKLEKGELTIVIGEKTGKRPTSFDEKGEIVVVLKKAKK